MRNMYIAGRRSPLFITYEHLVLRTAYQRILVFYLFHDTKFSKCLSLWERRSMLRATG